MSFFFLLITVNSKQQDEFVRTICSSALALVFDWMKNPETRRMYAQHMFP